MELYQLEYFRVLCKYGNFTSASEELVVTQPAVSAAIKKLEEEYGVELIDRESKMFALTHVGEAVLRHAIAIHNEISEMRDELNAGYQKRREVVRMAVPITMCPEVLPELLSNYLLHNKSVTLHLLQKGHAAIAQGLTGRGIDIGILSKDMVNPMLQTEEYSSVELFAVFSKQHRFCGCEYITPEMLNGENLIFAKMPNGVPVHIRRYLDEHNVQAKRTLHDGFPDGSASVAQTGKGIAFAPRSIAGEHFAPMSPPLYCNLVVAWNGKNPLTMEQRKLMDYIKKNTPALSR